MLFKFVLIMELGINNASAFIVIVLFVMISGVLFIIHIYFIFWQFYMV